MLGLTTVELQATQPSQFQQLLDENKLVVQTVNGMLQSTDSADGYCLVIICLVISKVLSAYATAAQTLCGGGCDSHKQMLDLSSASLVPSSSSLSSALPPWADAADRSIPTTLPQTQERGAKDVQQLLDELYQLRISVDRLGAKMQVCATRNWMSSSRSPPILHDLTLSAFPFSQTILNHMFTELRKNLSTISLELVNELKHFWS